MTYGITGVLVFSQYSTVKFATRTRQQTDRHSETTQPQRFGALTCHQIRCLAAGAAYAVCPQLAAASAATALQAFCLRTSMRRRMLAPSPTTAALDSCCVWCTKYDVGLMRTDP